MSEGPTQGHSRRTLEFEQVWAPHRPEYNDPYKDFERIRTIKSKVQSPKLKEFSGEPASPDAGALQPQVMTARQTLQRGEVGLSRPAHNQEIVGSNPTAATSLEELNRRVDEADALYRALDAQKPRCRKDCIAAAQAYWAAIEVYNSAVEKGQP